jgi:hypothetical protein
MIEAEMPDPMFVAVMKAKQCSETTLIYAIIVTAAIWVDVFFVNTMGV